MQPHAASKASRPYFASVEFVLQVTAGLMIAALIVCVVILSWVPPVSRDALIHHLAIPKLYLQQGRIYEIPSMVFSYYPMNLDLLYLLALFFKNDIAPNFIHFGFGLLTACLIFDYLKHRINVTYALGGALLFLSTPIIVKLSIAAYVDLGLTFFSMAALFMILRYWEKGFHTKHLVLAAVSCGLGLGTKYNGLIVLFILTCFVPFIYSRYAPRQRFISFSSTAHGLLFFLISLAVFSPWMIRNYVWKNNPIYPLYHGVFNASKPASNAPVAHTPAVKAQPTVKIDPGSLVYRAVAFQEKWWQIALLPIRIFFQGQDGSAQYFDGRLSPILLILPIFAFMGLTRGAKDRRDERVALLAFVVLYFAFTAFKGGMRIRYFIPMLPPLVILSVWGVHNILRTIQGWVPASRRHAGLCVVFSFLLFFLAFHAKYIVGQFKYVAPFGYLSGAVSRDAYIENFRPEYPAMQYINAELPPETRILFLFIGKRGYYCDREYIPEDPDFLEIARRSDGPHRLRAALRKRRVTHLLVNLGFLERWLATDFDESDRQRLITFFHNNMNLLFLKNNVGVFQIADLGE